MPERLPSVVRDPGSQRNFDALNEETNSLNADLGVVEERFPVAAKDLASSAKELFPQLATAGERKLGFSNAVITATGAQTANKAIEHGLGKAPVVVIATAASRDINVATFTYTSKEFTAEIRDITGANITANQEVHWIAIG